LISAPDVREDEEDVYEKVEESVVKRFWEKKMQEF
jgi:hypothetical protein